MEVDSLREAVIITMRIVQYTVGPVFNTKGGAEKVYYTYAGILGKEHNVINLYCSTNVNQNEGAPSFFSGGNIELINTIRRHRSGGKLPFTLWLKYRKDKLLHGSSSLRDRYRQQCKIESLALCLEEYKPDLIICYSTEALTHVEKTNFPLNKVIVMMHGNIEFISTYTSPEDFQLLKSVKAVQVLQEKDRERLRIMYGVSDNVCVIGNIVPAFKSLTNSDNKAIIYVGRMHEHEKRVHILIRAFEKLARKYPEWSLIVVGGDYSSEAYRKYISTLSKNLMAEERAFLVGKQENIEQYLDKASIFAFPSAGEGFPLALTEAMSKGLAVLGFKDANGVNDLIQNGVNGLLADTEEDFFKQLELLVINAELRHHLGRAANRSMKSYSASEIIKKWRELVLSVAK